MAGVAFRVTGATQAAVAFDRLAHELEGIDLGAVGELARAELEQTSPHGATGDLAASWGVVRDPSGVVVGSPLIYAPVQNFGGYHNIKGQHFVERSVELVTNKAGEIVSAQIDRLISEM